MKIYTRTGDKGVTSLIGGKRVPKHHPRIEAYGTVDELIAFVGLLRDQEINPDVKDFLIGIQDRLMKCAALLAVEGENPDVNLPEIVDADIASLEKEIDRMDNELPPLSSFILPGGHQTVSICHIARNVCRRAERNALKLDQGGVDLERVFKYLNRLSDYFLYYRASCQKILKPLK